jgi:hypothetical protein
VESLPGHNAAHCDRQIFEGETASKAKLTNAVHVDKYAFNCITCQVDEGGDIDMATNPPKGDDHRKGAVRDRSQVYNPRIDRWVKRDDGNGRFMDQKEDGSRFKGVRRER